MLNFTDGCYLHSTTCIIAMLCFNVILYNLNVQKTKYKNINTLVSFINLTFVFDVFHHHHLHLKIGSTSKEYYATAHCS